MTTASCTYSNESDATPDRRPSFYQAIKPALECAVALLLGVVLLPVTLLAMVAVRLSSPGSPLYSQTRLGRRGKPFTIYKVRSMRHNCERETGAKWCDPHDSRVTKLGWFLRASHIDEFPQLWNVIKGEMGLFGPRPERPEISVELERDVPEFRHRLGGTPGITGLAQVLLPPDREVNGMRDMRRVRQKLACDLYYLENATFWLDARILIATVAKVLGIPAATTARLLALPRPWLDEQTAPAILADDLLLAGESRF